MPQEGSRSRDSSKDAPVAFRGREDSDRAQGPARRGEHRYLYRKEDPAPNLYIGVGKSSRLVWSALTAGRMVRP